MTAKTPPNESCKSCPGLSAIRDHLKTMFDINQVTDVQFEKWLFQLGTDRFTISTQILSADDFVHSLCDALNTLKPHAYIAEAQAIYFKNLKKSISEGEIIVQCDFAENYSFVVQDAAPSFHWNNEQATLLTSVFYYTRRDGIEIKHGSIVMISDDLKHDTATYYAYQKKNYIKNRFNFVNLFYYKHDFNTNAEVIN